MFTGIFVLVSTEWPDVMGSLQVLLTPLTCLLKRNPQEQQDLHLICTRLLQIGQSFAFSVPAQHKKDV